jgi:p-hydroxybenzoate 3-monooxygenase
VRYRHAGRDYTLHCDYVAGCDGFHGVSRSAIPTAALRIYQKSYPCAWLGILAATPPASEELIYAYHERGFALQSMRSPTISRLYVQCAPDDEVENWTDEQIWQELRARLATEDSGEHLEPGPILERGVTAMRSFVAEPLRYGRLFLAGDAAHTVPPTGAKGMNLAIADVRVLAEAFARFYRRGSTDLLDAYSATCLQRIWHVQHFSWWMTTLLHQLGDPDDDFQHQIQLANLRSVVSSRAGSTYLAENYVGLERG